MQVYIQAVTQEVGEGVEEALTQKLDMSSGRGLS